MYYTLEHIEKKIANSPPHVKGVWEGEKSKLLQRESAKQHNETIWTNLDKVFRKDEDIIESAEEVIELVEPVDEEVEIFVQAEVEVCEPCEEVKKRKPRKKAAKKVDKQEEEE